MLEEEDVFDSFIFDNDLVDVSASLEKLQKIIQASKEVAAVEEVTERIAEQASAAADQFAEVVTTTGAEVIDNIFTSAATVDPLMAAEDASSTSSAPASSSGAALSLSSVSPLQLLFHLSTDLKHRLGYGWYILLVIIGGLAFIVGHEFVKYLRDCCKTAKRTKHLTTAIFITPITVFVFLSSLVVFGLLERGIADALSFGIVAGIIVQLSRKPKGAGSVKLIAMQAVDNKNVDVWLDSMQLTVGEVRHKIAEALDVSAHRVAIESGKGSFMDDLSTPFFPLIDDSLKTTDFFGFTTVLCYIFLREDDKKRVSIMDDNNDGNKEKQDKKGNKFLSILQQKPEIRYGESLSFLSKIADDTKSHFNFNISCVDKFAAAAPATMQLLHSAVVKLQSWDAITSELDNTDGTSDVGDAMSVSSSNNKSPKGFFRKRKHPESLKYGKPVCHGDMVVLQCSGKYMSVARGWWMAWSSAEPRRSGAFVVEIVEKASQTNKLKEQLKESIENIKEGFKEKIVRPGQVMIGQNNAGATSSTMSPSRELIHSNSFHSGANVNHHEVDNILRPGDIFRLRSVKFPEFQLGLTSVKIRDEYCYLGLSKIDGQENVNDESWCMDMLFTAKPTNEIFKI